MLKRQIILLLMLACSAEATQFWVAKTGIDSNSGVDSTHALASIRTAFGRKADGDTIYVCTGWYTESISIGSDEGFTLIGRGNPAPVVSGGVVCSTWTSLGSALYVNTELSAVYNSIWVDKLNQLQPAGSRASCASTQGMYYYDSTNDSLFVHLAGDADPRQHRMEVATTSGLGLLTCDYCRLNSRKVYIKNIEFAVHDGTGLYFSSARNNNPDTLRFDSVVVRCISGSTATYAVGMRLIFLDGTAAITPGYAEFNDCYFWGIYQRNTSAKVVCYVDFPGTVKFNRCGFGNVHVSENNNDFYFFDDAYKDLLDYRVEFNKCVWYNNSGGAISHALIGMSVESNLFDSCAFVRNVMGVDGCISFLNCSSSNVTNCAFVADSAVQTTSEGAISATLSSVHPGDGHTLTVRNTRIIECFANPIISAAATGLYMHRGADASNQTLYWTNNWIVGSSRGNGITLQDASLVNIVEHWGCTLFGNASSNYCYRHTSNGNGITPFGGSGSEYDTTLDTRSAVSTDAEIGLLERLNAITANYKGMSEHLIQYWEEVAGGSSVDTIAPGKVIDLGAAPGTGRGQIDLTWTASGDDNYYGRAARYQIFCSLVTIRTDNWQSIPPWPESSPPQLAGQREVFTLDELEPGQEYWIALQVLDETDNSSGVSNIVTCEAQIEPAGIYDDPTTLPERFYVHPSYPNPFNSSATIEYSVPARLPVRISVYDVLGRRIALITDEVQSPGEHAVCWNGTDMGGREMPTGVYFWMVRAGSLTRPVKMLLLK
jgi:hypothetical protein